MTRTTLVSAFSRAALVAGLALTAGCDAPTGDAHVDLAVMNQARAPMEQLMALTDVTVFQVEDGMELSDMPHAGGDVHVDSVVVTAFGEEGEAVFVPSSGVVGAPSQGTEEADEADERPPVDEDEQPRGFRLLWANFTSGGLGLNGDLELHAGGVATAEVEIAMGGQVSDLEMSGIWTQDGGGADVTMSGSMTDDQGTSWQVQTDALRLELGCTVASGGPWLAQAGSDDHPPNAQRFEVRYQEGCGGCADLFINDTPIGRSCVGGQ